MTKHAPLSLNIFLDAPGDAPPEAFAVTLPTRWAATRFVNDLCDLFCRQRAAARREPSAAVAAPPATSVCLCRDGVLLVNDGGDKHVESALYARFLPRGAGLLQHDWTYDHATPQAGYARLERLGFTPMYEDVAVFLNSCARFWLRTAVPEDAASDHD